VLLFTVGLCVYLPGQDSGIRDSRGRFQLLGTVYHQKCQHALPCYQGRTDASTLRNMLERLPNSHVLRWQNCRRFEGTDAGGPFDWREFENKCLHQHSVVGQSVFFKGCSHDTSNCKILSRRREAVSCGYFQYQY